ncbi:MAG: hypothetical protein EXS37_13640 [Opitutus sp.]|nr:hypothetical protein [Opitutus sp.]
MNSSSKFARCWLLTCSMLLSEGMAAEVSHAKIEESLRLELSGATGLGHGSPSRSVHEYVRRVAAAENLTREEIQTLLMKITEDGLTAPSGKDGTRVRNAASGSLVELAYIGDPSIMARLETGVETAPRELVTEFNYALLHIALREALDELPGVVRRLVSKQPDSIACILLMNALDFHPPADPRERERQIAVITEIFKEELRNPISQTAISISLDRALEKYDPSFRNSDERIRLLTEHSRSENANRKAYGTGKLEALASERNRVPPLTATKAESGAQKGIESGPKFKEEKLRKGEPVSGIEWSASRAVIFGVPALAVLAFLIWWKISKR